MVFSEQMKEKNHHYKRKTQRCDLVEKSLSREHSQLKFIEAQGIDSSLFMNRKSNEMKNDNKNW